MTTSSSPILSSKDPDETKKYGIDPTNILPTGATLTAAEIAGKVPGDIGAAAAVVSGIAVVTLTAGTADLDYAITVRMTFSNSETRDRTITVPCRVR